MESDSEGEKASASKPKGLNHIKKTKQNKKRLKKWKGLRSTQVIHLCKSKKYH